MLAINIYPFDKPLWASMPLQLANTNTALWFGICHSVWLKGLRTQPPLYNLVCLHSHREHGANDQTKNSTWITVPILYRSHFWGGRNVQLIMALFGSCGRETTVLSAFPSTVWYHRETSRWLSDTVWALELSIRGTRGGAKHFKQRQFCTCMTGQQLPWLRS